MSQVWNEPIVDTSVTYTLESDGKFFIVENVPARVNQETGEQYFSPATVEALHKIVLGTATPKRTIEAPVFEYTAVSP
jgi:hypothetical protein